MLKKLLIGLAVLGVVFLGLVAVAPFFIPIDQYRAQLIERVKDATGRDLAIAGDTYFSAFPHLALEVEGITLSNPPGMSSPDFMRAERLEVRLKMLPLLLGRIEISRFMLIQPVVALEVAPDGQPNWLFGPPGQDAGLSAPPPLKAMAPLPGKPAASGPTPTAPPPIGAMSASDVQASENAIEALHLDDIRLTDGSLTYVDRRGTQPLRALTHMRVNLSLTGLRRPFTAQGQASWHGREVNLALTVVDPASLLEGEGSGLSLQVSAKLLRFDFKGDMTRVAPLTTSGYVDIRMPSLRDWSDWFGTSWRLPGTGPGTLALTGNIDAGAGKIKLTNTALSLDEIRATGQLSVDTTGPRPLVQGLVDMDRFDLDSYWPGAPERIPGADSTFDLSASPDMAWGTLPPAGSGPAVKGKPTSPDNWDDQPIDWSALHLLDADLSLSAGQIYFRGLRLGRSSVDLHLHDRKLEVQLNRFQAYNGFGKGNVSIYDDGPKPTYQGRFNLSDIQLAPLLKDMVGVDNLTGIGTVDLALSSSGRSNSEIVDNLTGTGSVGINNGGLRGINLNTMMHTPTASGSLGKPTDVTVLTGASASVVIAEGTVRTREFNLRLPQTSVTGGGAVSLPRRELSIRMIPHTAGMTPVEITGPWSKLTYHTTTAAPTGARFERRPARQGNDPFRFLRRLFGGN